MRCRWSPVCTLGRGDRPDGSPCSFTASSGRARRGGTSPREIAARGYRVIAVDLPGHGESPPDAAASLDSCVEQVVAACPNAELAIGHSLGALVLAHCAHRIGVQRAVYVDSPFAYEMREHGDEYRRLITEVKTSRTLDWLATHRPRWSAEDRRAEARAARQFDVDTSLSLMTSMSGADHRPADGARSLVVVPRPSDHFTPADLVELRQRGVAVEHVDGAGHTVWYGHVDKFMSAISTWL